jgi:hypothetical protein
MSIPASERQKMLAVRLCGPRVIAGLESTGITELRDLARGDPYQLVREVNLAALRDTYRRRLRVDHDPFELTARAWAVAGTVGS